MGDGVDRIGRCRFGGSFAMSDQPPLWERMRAHPRAAEMTKEADAFEAATNGYIVAVVQTHTVKQFLGCAARARLKWCEITGEPLV